MTDDLIERAEKATEPKMCKESAISDSYWVIELRVFCVATREQADALRDKIEAAIIDMPEAEELTVASKLVERNSL